MVKLTKDVPLMSVYCNFLMDILKISSLQTELSNSKNHGQVTILKKHTETGKSQYTVETVTGKY